MSGETPLVIILHFFCSYPDLPLNFPAILHYSSIRHGTGTQNGNKKIVKLALKYGCEINAVNGTGNTALHFATRFGHAELAQYLIDKGADV
jgi:hypothetical protein